MSVEDNKFTLINLYGPNKDTPLFFENIINIAETIGNTSLIICGDFNTVQDEKLDYCNYKCINNKKSHEKILEIKKSYNLYDPFRETYPSLKRYTWRKKSPLKQARLDFFLISEALLPSVNKSSVEASYRSDHSMIILDISFIQFQKGKPLWKHNNSLLHDKDYIKLINEKIDEIKRQYALPVYDIENIQNIPDDQIQFTINDQLFLETLLMELRGKSISYSSYKKKEREKRETDLIKNIEALESNLSNTNLDDIENLKEELTTIRKNKMQGILVRSRAQLIEDDEKPTFFFFCNLEKHNYASKIIPKLEKNDGKIITDQFEILNETKRFYEELYSSKDNELININLQDLFRNVEIKKLNTEESKAIEGPIKYEEVALVLKAMSNNRSPGSDGFSAEFFKMFWKKIGYFIIRSINYGFIKGELSATQREGIITCIPKDNKPRHFIKNYRPISLLNCVYKIASGVIAHRIKSTIHKIIHADQTGFIAGRYIGENTRLVYDIMQYTEENNIPGLLLLIDFEKAFDSVSWSFLYKVLELFGYGNSVIPWKKLFNCNARLSVNQCGNLSSFFYIGRGCRQGDPISPFLFILCAEILGIMIRNNQNITGIIINEKEHKLSQYADDTLFFLDGTSKSLNETLNVLFEFSKFSGLKVNFGKTHAVWIGLNKCSTESIKTRWKLSWGKIDFKLLGIIFHVNLDQMQRINYTDKIQKISSLIKLWKRRYLTPLGKITVIKTLLLPLLNHLFISIPNPNDQILTELNKIFFEFLWEGPAKIKQNVVVKQYCEGGIKMINLKAFINSMKLTWLKRMILSDSPWQSVIKKTISFDELLSLGKSYTDSLLRKNKFWIDVLKAYSEILQVIRQNTEEFVLSSPIFHNHNINIGNKPVWINNWYKNGVKHINDLISENGEFYLREEFERIYNIKTNFVQYQGIIHAIRAYARSHNIIRFSSKLKLPFIPVNIHLFIKSKQGGKDFYTLLNRNSDINLHPKLNGRSFIMSNKKPGKLYMLHLSNFT